MTVTLHWFLPTNGDSRSDLSLGNAVGTSGSRIAGETTERAPDVAYMGQIARSAEQLGFDAALTPTSSWCEDAWVMTARDTADEAWAEADRLLAGLSQEEIERAQAVQRASQSEGQRRMTQLHGGRTDGLEVSANLWAGVGLVRGGAGTALVGSYEEVADRIAEYHELGIDEFILSGYPHLEEAYRVGEGVMPILRRRGLMAGRVGGPEISTPVEA